jgi:hypothetical protein
LVMVDREGRRIEAPLGTEAAVSNVSPSLSDGIATELAPALALQLPRTPPELTQAAAVALLRILLRAAGDRGLPNCAATDVDCGRLSA